MEDRIGKNAAENDFNESSPLLLSSGTQARDRHTGTSQLAQSSSADVLTARPPRRPSSAIGVPESHKLPSSRASFAGMESHSIQQPSSWSNYCRPSPYTAKNKPNRRPFHLPNTGSANSVLLDAADDDAVYMGPCGPASRAGSGDEHSQLYTRYKYYSRLRAPADPADNALVIPDHVVPLELFLPYIPGTTRGSDGKQASYITIISIWNTMMGTSLLTMPWAFGEAGFVGGLVIMIVMASICFFTAYKILTLQRTAGLVGNMMEASQLCREVMGGGPLGRLMEGGAVLFSIMTLLGALVVYWVLMSNFLYNTGMVIHDSIYNIKDMTNISAALLCPRNRSLIYNGTELVDTVVNDTQTVVDNTLFNQVWDLDVTVPFYLLVVFVPLLCIKNMQIFSYFNSLGAVSVMAIYTFVVTKAFSWGLNINFTDPDDPFFVPLIRYEFMALSGTLSLAYFIHNCIITIMKGNRHQENNVRDLAIAYVLVSLTYIPIGVLFFVTFPLPKYCLADNFLNNFPPHLVVLAIVRVFLLFQMTTVFPLLCVFLRVQLLSYCRGHSAPPPSAFLEGCVNVCILTACLLTATLYPKVGFLIRWVGAFAGLLYIFLLPCGLHLRALYSKGELSVCSALILGVIMTLGVVNFLSQFLL